MFRAFPTGCSSPGYFNLCQWKAQTRPSQTTFSHQMFLFPSKTLNNTPWSWSLSKIMTHCITFSEQYNTCRCTNPTENNPKAICTAFLLEFLCASRLQKNTALGIRPCYISHEILLDKLKDFLLPFYLICRDVQSIIPLFVLHCCWTMKGNHLDSYKTLKPWKIFF